MPFARETKRLITPVVDLLLPPACWAEGTGEVSLGLSETARTQIAELSAQPYCHHCGLTVGPYEVPDARNPCGRCGTRDVGVVRLARTGTFTEPLVTLVHRHKFGRAWEVARVLAPFLYQGMLRVSEQSGVTVEALVPIPLHWRRRAARGFNQAEELAREVSRLAGLPVVNALRRTRATLEQAKTASAAQRADNLRGAFAARASAMKQLTGKNAWLIDDVTTTGATLHAAAVALRKVAREDRAASINAAVICVTDHDSPPPTTA
jgi:ComF family protein